MSAERELEEIKRILTQIRDQKDLSSNPTQNTADLNRYANELKIARAELKQLEEGSFEYNKKQREVESLSEKTRKSLAKQREEVGLLSSAYSGLAGAMSLLGSAADTAVGFFGELVNKVAAEAKELDTMTMGFRAATGASEELSGQIGRLSDRLKLYGVSIQQAGQAVKSLQADFSLFTQLSQDQQDTFVVTTGLLQELGISASQSGQILETSMRGMGLSVAESNKFLIDMRGTAKALQVPIEQITRDFQAAEVRISQLGDRGPRAFEKLSAASKGTGVAVNDLLGIVGQFDTFTGAAQVASKLGAVLGTAFIDPITMMQLEDPADQIEYLTDALEKSGMTAEKYQNMHRQNKLAIASAFGTDTLTMAKLLSGEIDSLNESLEQSTYGFEEMKTEAFKLKGFDDIVNNFGKALISPVTEIQKATRASFEGFTSLIGDFDKFNASIADRTKEFIKNNSEIVGNIGLLYNLANIDGVQKGYQIFKGIASFSGMLLSNLFSVKGVLALMVGGALYSISDKFEEIRKVFDDDGFIAGIKKTFSVLKDKFMEVRQELIDDGFNKEFFSKGLEVVKSFASQGFHFMKLHFFGPMYDYMEFDMLPAFGKMLQSFMTKLTVRFKRAATKNTIESLIPDLRNRYGVAMEMDAKLANYLTDMMYEDEMSKADPEAGLTPEQIKHQRKIRRKGEYIQSIGGRRTAVDDFQKTKGYQTAEAKVIDVSNKIDNKIVKPLMPVMARATEAMEKGVDFMGKKANESVEASKVLAQKFEEGYDRGHVNITLPDTIVLQTENGSLEAVVSPIARQEFDNAIKSSMK
tara:strand:- start:184 stop:2610 length:2427 start_codon:yes stop_codon:yes gene_type:complete